MSVIHYITNPQTLDSNVLTQICGCFDSELQVLEAARLKALDSRSFIMRKPELEQTPPVRSRLTTVNQNEEPPTTSRMVQARYDRQVLIENNIQSIYSIVQTFEVVNIFFNIVSSAHQDCIYLIKHAVKQ